MLGADLVVVGLLRALALRRAVSCRTVAALLAVELEACAGGGAPMGLGAASAVGMSASGFGQLHGLGLSARVSVSSSSGSILTVLLWAIVGALGRILEISSSRRSSNGVRDLLRDLLLRALSLRL